MNLPDLRTGRLHLRPVQFDDLTDISLQIDDFDVAKMVTTVPHPYSLGNARDWFEQTATRKEGGERAFAIDMGEGLLGVVSIGRRRTEPEFGYWLGKVHWGQGIMTEAGRALLSWHFDCFPDDTVMSGALNENHASLNVLSKLGFSEKGPYKLKILSRGKELPGTRMVLQHKDFLENERMFA
jgi:RimJ/RimL family protein N-acetyltransferase